jgi:hypothetical protein
MRRFSPLCNPRSKAERAPVLYSPLSGEHGRSPAEGRTEAPLDTRSSTRLRAEDQSTHHSSEDNPAEHGYKRSRLATHRTLEQLVLLSHWLLVLNSLF